MFLGVPVLFEEALVDPEFFQAANLRDLGQSLVQFLFLEVLEALQLGLLLALLLLFLLLARLALLLALVVDTTDTVFDVTRMAHDLVAALLQQQGTREVVAQGRRQLVALFRLQLLEAEVVFALEAFGFVEGFLIFVVLDDVVVVVVVHRGRRLRRGVFPHFLRQKLVEEGGLLGLFLLFERFHLFQRLLIGTFFFGTLRR